MQTQRLGQKQLERPTRANSRTVMRQVPISKWPATPEVVCKVLMFFSPICAAVRPSLAAGTSAILSSDGPCACHSSQSMATKGRRFSCKATLNIFYSNKRMIGVALRQFLPACEETRGAAKKQAARQVRQSEIHPSLLRDTGRWRHRGRIGAGEHLAERTPGGSGQAARSAPADVIAANRATKSPMPRSINVRSASSQTTISSPPRS